VRKDKCPAEIVILCIRIITAQTVVLLSMIVHIVTHLCQTLQYYFTFPLCRLRDWCAQITCVLNFMKL